MLVWLRLEQTHLVFVFVDALGSDTFGNKIESNPLGSNIFGLHSFCLSFKVPPGLGEELARTADVKLTLDTICLPNYIRICELGNSYRQAVVCRTEETS